MIKRRAQDQGIILSHEAMENNQSIKTLIRSILEQKSFINNQEVLDKIVQGSKNTS